MASGAGPTLAHRSVASIRSAPAQGQGGPASPHTPPRTIASTYGSPSTIRADDDIIVIELGSRFIRVGFAGDSLPKATLQCGTDQQRRVGDFRAWQNPQRRSAAAWAAEHEIWRYDLRQIDLGLIQDKLDRLLREAFTKYLLIDSRPRRMALVLDSAVPLPLLSSVLEATFDRFQTPMVSLLPSATMSAVAAGVRSALVVNMGWTETVVTSVYEYREVKSTRTVRGGRYLLDELYRKLLCGLVGGDPGSQDAQRLISFEEVEDIMCRLVWCRPAAFRSSQRHSAQLETVEEQDETEAEASTTPQSSGSTFVPLTSTHPPRTIEVPFEKLADVCDDTFFDAAAPPASFDDHELPLHKLVYQHLLQLPIDARAICMSRIIFAGGCSNILGIKERIVDEVSSTVDRRGWEAVHGKGVDQVHANPKISRKGPTQPSSETSSPGSETEDGQSDVSAGAAHAGPESDPIEEKVFRHKNKTQQKQGQLRALHSLGPWTGASLMCQMKIPAVATIDRDLWLQQGVNGASRPNEVDTKVQQRQSMGAGSLIRGSGGHHTNWTLGTWGNL